MSAVVTRDGNYSDLEVVGASMNSCGVGGFM
jgi:hypothetical protein